MRIGVDATSWTNRRGYGRFARDALTRLVERNPSNTYVFYVDANAANRTDIPERAEQRLVTVSRAPAAFANRGPLELLRLGRAAGQDDFDLFLFPSVYTYFPVGVRTVVGVHDVIARTYPELTLPGRRDRIFWKLKERLAIRRATAVFTVSEASRAELARVFGLRPERIAVVPEAPAPAFRPREPGEVESARAELGVRPEERVVVYAAGLSPHKNVEALVDAFAALRQNGSSPVRLVIAGDIEGDAFHSAAESIRDRIHARGIAEHVLLPGFVSDDQLASLYTGAGAAVVPSLAEGFGLPAVEAAACGAPVLLSALPAHRESLGEAALYFSPTDTPALTALLERTLADPDAARARGEDARHAVSRLTWDAAADALQAVLEEAATR